MDDGFAHCEALVRAADKDRFLSVLFAPAEHRGALYALYAFNVEMARVRELVKEPLAGEIRLQWWREALAGGRPGEARGHPVAAALTEVIGRYRLPPHLFEELIEARRFDLSNELPGNLEQVEHYVRHTQSNLIELAALILGTAVLDIAGPAGISIGVTGLLRRFAVDAASGRLVVPADLLVRHKVLPQDVFAGQSSEGLVAALAVLRDLAARRYEEAQALTREKELVVAWLPAALVPLDLRALRRGARRPFRPIVVPQWRRQWALWRAARRGRLGPL
jgi:15-cis-phytoene synthase